MGGLENFRDMGGSSGDYWEHVRQAYEANGTPLPPRQEPLGTRAMLTNVAPVTGYASLTAMLQAEGYTEQAAPEVPANLDIPSMGA